MLERLGVAARRPPRRPAAPRRSRPRRRACCRPAGRAPGRRRSRRPSRPAARGARSRRRSSCPAAAPRAGGPRRCRSARAGGSSCRGRCAPRCRRRRCARASRQPCAASAAVSRGGQRRVVAGLHRSQVEDHRARARSARRRPATRPGARASSASGAAAGSADGARRQRLARQRPAADGRLGVDDLGAARRSPRRSPRPGRRRSVDGWPRSGARPGSRATATPARYSASVAATAASIDLVGPHRAGERVLAQPGDEVGAADDEPGLRPADQLVAAERHEVGAGGEALARASARGRGRRRAVSSSAPLPRSSTTSAPWRWATPASAGGVRRLHEPGLAEVRRVDAQDEPGPAVGEGRLEVGDARPVRRPDLDQPRAGAPHDLRDPDAAADLDELAAATPRRRPGRPARPRARRPPRCCSTTSASSAPVRATRCVLGLAEPRAAPAGRAVQLEEASSPRPRPRGASIAARGHGARPRLVWTMTPVALMTPARARRRARGPRGGRPARRRGPPGSGPCGVATPARRARSSSTTARAIASTAAGSRSPVSAAGGREHALDARGSRGGRLAHRAIIAGRPAALAGAHGSRTHRATPSAAPPVLKTGGPTGTPPLPGRDGSARTARPHRPAAV